MILSRKKLAQEGIVKAMQTRLLAKCDQYSPINIFDLAEQLGLSVFFQDIPSMEGVYSSEAKPRPAIIISSLRPSGRKALTCGHELGHHVFQHGTQWDELVERRAEQGYFQPEEFLVDIFSASIQMPKAAVSHQLAIRKLDPLRCSPERIYAISTLFGVSYGGFITHLEKTLSMIDTQRSIQLSKFQPRDLRASILGCDCPQNLLVVDTHWKGIAVDIEVGDRVLLPPTASVEGLSARMEETSGRRLIVGSTPGICRVTSSCGWSAFIRVSRKDYVGRAPYRFDEIAEDD